MFDLRQNVLRVIVKSSLESRQCQAKLVCTKWSQTLAHVEAIAASWDKGRVRN